MNLNYFGLRKEAFLLDSHLYILKAMIALAFAYTLGRLLPLTRLDMVSVLLGVMYNLEAANVIGLKGGLNQLLASTLGAVVTGLLIIIAGHQVGLWTIILGMGLTMWMALKIDYRFVSPVAIFTSLYMNLLLQRNAMGDLSVFNTIVIRLAALGFGISIALLFNFLFSFIYYRNIGHRRLEYVKNLVLRGLKSTLALLKTEKQDHKHLDVLVGLFGDIETVKAHLDSLEQERFWLSQDLKKELKPIQASVLDFKNILHLAYDALYLKEDEGISLQVHQVEDLESMIQALENLDFLTISPLNSLSHEATYDFSSCQHRFDDSLMRIQGHFKRIQARIQS